MIPARTRDARAAARLERKVREVAAASSAIQRARRWIASETVAFDWEIKNVCSHDIHADPRQARSMHTVDLKELERYVVNELDNYQYEVSDDALGNPQSDEWVRGQLAELRDALVKPQWRDVELRDRPRDSGSRQCVLVADDGDTYQVYYDPVEREFVLAVHDPPETIGVRGDVVGCFMAR